MLDPSIAIAVLAAGRARRFGAPKLDAPCAGKALGDWVLDAAEQAGFAQRLIIVPPEQPCFLTSRRGWRTIENRQPDEGLASSIRHAVEAATDANRLVIVLADMPLVDAAHLRALATARGVVFTAYPEGGSGVPAAFPSTAFAALARLSGQEGAATAFAKTVTSQHISIGATMLTDVDTPEDLARVEKMLSNKVLRGQ